MIYGQAAITKNGGFSFPPLFFHKFYLLIYKKQGKCKLHLAFFFFLSRSYRAKVSEGICDTYSVLKRGGFLYLSWKKQKKHTRLIKYALSLIALFLIAFLLINITISPQLLLLAERETETFYTCLIQASATNAFAHTDSSYRDMIEISYKSDGSVSSMQSNLALCNRICADILSSISEAVSEERLKCVSVPLGTLSGLAFLSGYGPTCDVRLVPANALRGCLESSFEEEGINQTRHRIWVSVKLKITFLLPNYEKERDLTVKIPLIETVLLGNVPDAYTKINRLTDDIIESEIDDIYDFGASTQ